jgi:hypothetical protein
MQERGGTQVARGGQPPILAAPAVQTETAALRE